MSRVSSASSAAPAAHSAPTTDRRSGRAHFRRLFPPPWAAAPWRDGGRPTAPMPVTSRSSWRRLSTAEAEAIQRAIEALRARGVPYREQVILGRSHLTLARITGILEQLGIPLLYLGDLFERPEIRDLLSLSRSTPNLAASALSASPRSPEYQVSRDEALAVIRWAQAQRITIFDALKRTAEIEGLSEAGRAGLAQLGVELDGLGRGHLALDASDHMAFRTQRLSAAVARRQRRSLPTKARRDLSAAEGLRRAGRASATKPEALSRPRAPDRGIERGHDLSCRRVRSRRHGCRSRDDHPRQQGTGISGPFISRRWQRATCRPTGRASAARRRHGSPTSPCSRSIRGGGGMPVLRRVIAGARSFVPEPRRTLHRGQCQRIQISRPPCRIVRASRFEGSRPGRSPNRPLAADRAAPALRGARTDALYACARRDTAMNSSMGSAACATIPPTSLSIAASMRPIGWLEEEAAQRQVLRPAAAQQRLAAEWATRGPVGHGFEDYYRNTAERMVAALWPTPSPQKPAITTGRMGRAGQLQGHVH